MKEIIGERDIVCGHQLFTMLTAPASKPLAKLLNVESEPILLAKLCAATFVSAYVVKYGQLATGWTGACARGRDSADRQAGVRQEERGVASQSRERNASPLSGHRRNQRKMFALPGKEASTVSAEGLEKFMNQQPKEKVPPLKLTSRPNEGEGGAVHVGVQAEPAERRSESSGDEHWEDARVRTRGVGTARRVVGRRHQYAREEAQHGENSVVAGLARRLQVGRQERDEEVCPYLAALADALDQVAPE